MNFLIAPIDADILCDCNENTATAPTTIIVNGGALTTLEFTIGSGLADVPLEGATSYRNALLAGNTVGAIFLQSLGDFVTAPEWENNTEGGFDWIAGRQFHDLEHYTIFYTNATGIDTNGGGYLAQFTSEEVQKLKDFLGINNNP